MTQATTYHDFVNADEGEDATFDPNHPLKLHFAEQELRDRTFLGPEFDAYINKIREIMAEDQRYWLSGDPLLPHGINRGIMP